MKAKKETTLFTVLTGSHLYGTATESSDFDYKAVCLPPLDELLLNTKITNRKEKPEGVSQYAKMGAGQVETEYLPLQVFFNDFFDGQTYALEIAFAVLQGKLDVTKDAHLGSCPDGIISSIFEDLVNIYLTKNVQKMVGYAVSQSKLYGLKTQRYTSLSDALRIFQQCGHELEKQMKKDDQLKLTLADLPELLSDLLKLDHVKQVEILNGDGGTALVPALEICNKQFPLTNRVSTVVKSIEKSVGNYGHRVKEFEGEGVDWKALSHAIRITEQVLELCRTGFLQFPRPNARFLLDVKSGKLTLDEATGYLNRIFSEVDPAVLTSKLQERTLELETSFKAWKIQVLRELYDVN
jgi:hypothetical protein